MEKEKNKTELNSIYSIILTILLGPLGIFYSSKRGGYWMTSFTLVYGLIIFEKLGTIPLNWYIFIIILSVFWGYLATANYNKRLKIEEKPKKDYILEPYQVTKEGDSSLSGFIIDIIIGLPQVVVFLAILFGHYNYVVKGFWFY